MNDKPEKKKRGRKPRKIKRVALTIRVEPHVADAFQTLRHEMSLSQSEFMACLVKTALISSLGGMP
jgi:hypothetical protein